MISKKTDEHCSFNTTDVSLNKCVHFLKYKILCWGLRDIKSKKPLRLLKPSVKFECNQETLLSSEISDMRNCPNFSSPMLIWKKLVSQL